MTEPTIEVLKAEQHKQNEIVREALLALENARRAASIVNSNVQMRQLKDESQARETALIREKDALKVEHATLKESMAAFKRSMRAKVQGSVSRFVHSLARTGFMAPIKDMFEDANSEPDDEIPRGKSSGQQPLIPSHQTTEQLKSMEPINLDPTEQDDSIMVCTIICFKGLLGFFNPLVIIIILNVKTITKAYYY